MLARLPDQLLDSCRCNLAAPFGGDPARDFALHKDTGNSQLAALKRYLDEQQQLLWANRSQTVLIWLQGPDCSGKDGVIRKLFCGLNPQGVQVSNFQLPSAAERNESFLARYRRRLPAPGSIGIFNRTPYEGVVGDVHDGIITPAAVPERLQQIADFEDELSGAGIHLLKIYLQISPAEQFKRLRKRIITPHKRWKLSAADLQGHRQFERYQTEWANTLSSSHRPAAPWYVLPADHKWLRNLLLASLLARQFEAFNQQWPMPPLPFSLAQLQQPQS